MTKRVTRPHKKKGRPTKYRVEYLEKTIELMEQGYTKEMVVVELGIVYATFLTWQEQHPAFLKAVKAGEHAARAWWARKVMEQALGDKDIVLGTGFVMLARNALGWKTKDPEEKSSTEQLATLLIQKELKAKTDGD